MAAADTCGMDGEGGNIGMVDDPSLASFHGQMRRLWLVDQYLPVVGLGVVATAHLGSGLGVALTALVPPAIWLVVARVRVTLYHTVTPHAGSSRDLDRAGSTSCGNSTADPRPAYLAAVVMESLDRLGDLSASQQGVGRWSALGAVDLIPAVDVVVTAAHDERVRPFVRTTRDPALEMAV